jgi:hypothetical protein
MPIRLLNKLEYFAIMEMNIFNYRDIGHWIQLVLHFLPLVISIPVIIRHYQWRKEIKHNNANQLEEISRLTFTSLQLLLFISIYLAGDTFFSLHSIDSNTNETRKNTELILSNLQSNNNGKDKTVKGIDAVYQEISDVFEGRKDNQQFLTVDIIAYTSFTIEPRLEIWKSSNYLHDMVLHIYHMDMEFIRNSPDIDLEWVNKVAINTQLLKGFISENKLFFKNRNVNIQLHSYRHIPGIHGVRVKNEKTVVSFSNWNLKNGHIKMPNDEEWIVVNKSEISSRGTLLNNLFDNWVTALSNKNNK